jgi:hypothetical protein
MGNMLLSACPNIYLTWIGIARGSFEEDVEKFDDNVPVALPHEISPKTLC